MTAREFILFYASCSPIQGYYIDQVTAFLEEAPQLRSDRQTGHYGARFEGNITDTCLINPLT